MTSPSWKELQDHAQELLQKAREERDELRVQLHLAGAEARDEWEKLEPRFEELQARAHAVAQSAGEASADIGAALRLLGEELQHGYARVRAALRRSE